MIHTVCAANGRKRSKVEFQVVGGTGGGGGCVPKTRNRNERRKIFFFRLDHIEAFLLSYHIGPVRGRGEYDSHLITFCIKHVFRYDLIFCSPRILILRLNKIIRGVNAFYFYLHYKNKIARVVSQLRFTPVKRMREVLARYLTEIMS